MRAILLALAFTLGCLSAAGAVSQVVPLAVGYNFFGALGTPDSADGYAPAGGTVTSRFLIDTVAGVEAVFRLNPATQAFEYQIKLPGGDPFGAEFPIEEQRGYVLRSSVRKSLGLVGYVTRTAPVALAAGFNLIACPDVAAISDLTGLFTLAGGAQSAFAWDRDAQAFAFRVKLPDGSLFGRNRALAAGESLIVRVAEPAALPLLTAATGPDLYLYNAWLDGTPRSGGLVSLNLPVHNLGPGTAELFTARWTLTTVDAGGRPAGGVIAGERSFGPLAVGDTKAFTTEIELPNVAGALLVTVAIDDGAPLADPNRGNNGTSFLATLLPPALAPVLATARTPVDGTFTVTGLALAGQSTSEVSAMIIGSNGWGYGCGTRSTTPTSATFEPYWGQTAGPYRVSVHVGTEWAIAGTLEVQPVVAGTLPGHVFRVRGVAYPSIYRSGIAGNGLYSDLNTSDQTATANGAPTGLTYLAPTGYPDEGLVRLPGLSTFAGQTIQIRFTVNGVEQAADYGYAVPPASESDTWWVLDQHGALPMDSYTLAAGTTRRIVNGDIRPRSAEVTELALDTGRLAPGQNGSFTFATAGTYTLKLFYYTLDNTGWVKSAPETKTVIVP